MPAKYLKKHKLRGKSQSHSSREEWTIQVIDSQCLWWESLRIPPPGNISWAESWGSSRTGNRWEDISVESQQWPNNGPSCLTMILVKKNDLFFITGMVNCMCQFDLAKGQLVKHYFWVSLWRHYWKKLVFGLVKQVVLPMWVGIIQSMEGPDRTKTWRKGEFILSPWAETSIFPYLQHQPSWVLGLLDSDEDQHHYPTPYPLPCS